MGPTSRMLLRREKRVEGVCDRAYYLDRLSPGTVLDLVARIMMRVLFSAAAVATFLRGSCPAPLPPAAASDGAVGPQPQLAAVPFALSQVELTPGSRLRSQMDANTNWLLGLNESRLACLYTSAANLTCSSSGVPYRCVAGAQKPACDPYPHVAYYGHFLGHYLSATALAFANTGNASIKARADSVVNTLAKVQTAHTANGEPGLIFPFDVRSFQNLYDKADPSGRPGDNSAGNCEPVCVPWYVVHKILAGLLDQHTHAGNPLALEMATKLAAWVTQSVEGAIKSGGIRKWQSVLNIEWGGMNEALFNLYSITHDPVHFTTGLRFNHWQFTSPLAIGQDDLDGSHGNWLGNHANTHIPVSVQFMLLRVGEIMGAINILWKSRVTSVSHDGGTIPSSMLPQEVVGDARGYELTGNATQHSIAAYFFDILTAGENETWNPRQPGGHSFATGGSNVSVISPPHQTVLPALPGSFTQRLFHPTPFSPLRNGRHTGSRALVCGGQAGRLAPTFALGQLPKYRRAHGGVLYAVRTRRSRMHAVLCACAYVAVVQAARLEPSCMQVQHPQGEPPLVPMEC
jgi:hypothetical protein